MAKVDAGVCRPPVAAPVPLGYRNKITLHADRTETGTRLGYFSEDNTSILDVASCPLACEPISVALTEMRTDTGFLRRLHRHVSVTLRHTHTDGVITYTTDDNASSIPADDRCAPLTEQTSLGLITVPYNSFFQVNPAVAELLLSRVTDLLTQIQPDAVADIYCGVGLFAIAAAKLGIAQTHGVDYDAGAIRTAEINAKRHGLRIRFTAGQAARMTARTMGLCPPARTALVLDPPRRGLDPGVTQAILSSKPADLIYVSCAPDTLTRDIRVLAAAGYEVKSTGILDMFPRTPHFESVTHLSRV
jgi:23S rRNA (uracil1939-C5)-methyltransferase